MEVKFKQAKDWVSEFTEIHYDPMGWQLHNLDARTIVPTFQKVFETDFRVHCDEEGQEYSTSYDTIRDFLSSANLEGKYIIRLSCIIPIQGENHHVIIDFKENTLYILFDKHVDVDDVKLSLFDPAIQKISHFLSQSKHDSLYSFHKRIKDWKLVHHMPTEIEYEFHPAQREKHDMIVLKAFDQRFHLSTIYTVVWDQERHFWRTFEGLKQYREEAPTDRIGFYEYLDEISFNIVIDKISYRVRIDLDDRLSLSRIEIQYDDTDSPYDFTPVMEELASLIPQRKQY